MYTTYMPIWKKIAQLNLNIVSLKIVNFFFFKKIFFQPSDNQYLNAQTVNRPVLSLYPLLFWPQLDFIKRKTNIRPAEWDIRDSWFPGKKVFFFSNYWPGPDRPATTTIPYARQGSGGTRFITQERFYGEQKRSIFCPLGQISCYTSRLIREETGIRKETHLLATEILQRRNHGKKKLQQVA